MTVFKIAFLYEGAWEDQKVAFITNEAAESYGVYLEELARVKPLDWVVYCNCPHTKTVTAAMSNRVCIDEKETFIKGK